MTMYHISDAVVHTHDDPNLGYLARALCLRCMLDLHIGDGELVPVEPCIHGNYARHLYEVPLPGSLGIHHESEPEWCDGAKLGDAT